MISSFGRVTVLATSLLLSPRAGQEPTGPLGRWIGDSHCVGPHPACHDEHVIYRIDSVGPHQFRMDGSRTAGRDTVDMGALSCESAGAQSQISCHIPSGTWHFSVVQGRLVGFLTLTDSTVMRRVVAYRAQPN